MPPKQQEKNNARFEELILKLEDRLSIFNESELKKVVARDLVVMRDLLNQLEEVHTRMYENVGMNYQDIHYGKNT